MRVDAIEINGRRIGPGWPAYVVAELSANHHHDFEEAVRLVVAARNAGADAVKLQTYTPDTLTVDCHDAAFQIRGSAWDGQNLYELYRDAYMPWEWQPKLLRVAHDIGIDLFSSPFDTTAVDFLDEIGMPALKIASAELVDHALIGHAAHTGRPLILSTGMASRREIEAALTVAFDAGARQVALLKCTSSYPAPVADMNLRTIPHMQETLGVPVGLSDHSIGIAVAVAAVALGASIVEKHLTLARSVPGPDSGFSLEPEEFKQLVDAVRATESALGTVCYGPAASETASLKFRRSLFAVRDIKAGEVFTADAVRSIRPSGGLGVEHLADILGRRAAVDIRRGTPLQWDLVVRP